MIEGNYRSILAKIEAAARASGRGPREITLVAVSKKQPLEKIEELYRLGHRDFGENYVQELVAKAQALRERGLDGIRWHFIGHLQSNKAKALLPHVSCIHSIDSEKLAKVLADSCVKLGRAERLPVFIEVNLSGEASKSGVSTDRALEVAHAVGELPQLALQGLMCIPAAESSPEQLAQDFGRLEWLEAALGAVSLRKLSMGMSSDFELAIRQGATHIRVGTALFGAR